MTRLPWFLLLAAAMPLTTACMADVGDDALGSDDEALLGGTPTTHRPEVVKLRTSVGMCTATMITGRTFLTAAHCIDFQPMSPGGTVTFVDGTSVPVQRIFAQGGGAIGKDDLAVGNLASPVTTITPASIGTAQPSNTNLTVIGNGCTQSRTQGCSSAARTFITYFYAGQNTSNYSFGDSGGPTFLGGLDDGGPIVRVASAFTDPGGVDVGADPVTYRPQLLALSGALQASGVSYRAQVQSLGWTAAVTNGGVSGTTGQSLRLEGLQVWTQNPGESICYTGFVQDVGWQAEVCDGALAGTVGQARRMEAIRIRHVGGNGFVRYRAYVQGIGWQAWQTNNAVAGTTGQSRRIEAIQIQLF